MDFIKIKLQNKDYRKWQLYGLRVFLFVLVLGFVFYYFGGLKLLAFFILFLVALLIADVKLKERVLNRLKESMVEKKLLSEEDFIFDSYIREEIEKWKRKVKIYGSPQKAWEAIGDEVLEEVKFKIDANPKLNEDEKKESKETLTEAFKQNKKRFPD